MTVSGAGPGLPGKVTQVVLPQYIKARVGCGVCPAYREAPDLWAQGSKLASRPPSQKWQEFEAAASL